MNKYYLYCMATKDSGRNGVCNPVKIGISSDPSKRLSTIQTSCPKRVEIAFVLQCFNSQCASVLEDRMHAAFNDKRTNGEWFDISPEEAAEVAIHTYDHFLIYGAGKDLWDFSELVRAREVGGLVALEEKLAEVRYLAAWEQQPA